MDAILAAVSSDSLQETLEDLEEHKLAGEIPVVLLVEQNSISQWNRSLRLGVRAIVPFEVDGLTLRNALLAVASGLVVISPHAVGQLPNTPPSRRTEIVEESVESLTPREREVLRMMGDGLANKEIATRLRISDHTVKFHVASILGKLGASTRTEAVTIAMRRGLLML